MLLHTQEHTIITAVLIIQNGRSSIGSVISLGEGILPDEDDDMAGEPETDGTPSARLPNNCTSRTLKDKEAPAVPSCLVKLLTSGEPSTNTWVPLVR